MEPINYEQLAQEVKERKESSPEFQSASHKEVLSNMLREHRPTAQHTDDNQSSVISNQSSDSSDGLASYAKDAPQDAKQKTESLIQHTFEHGLREGIAKAAKEDPYILDLYHDTLTEQLYQQLK